MEVIRKVARNIFGYQSLVYRMAAWALSTFETIKFEGWKGERELRRIRASEATEEVLRLQSLQHPITVRPGTDDLHSILNNAIRKEYGQFKKAFLPKVIVDAGAYIGDTSAYFLSRFPDSRVISLEPNPISFNLAVRNLAPYGERVCVLQAALWNEVTELKISGEQTGATLSEEGISVTSESISSLMKKFSLEFIDVLKLDIEGAEVEVILNLKSKWLRRLGMILLETHGKEIEGMTIPYLTEEGFLCERFRNVWYCSRIS